MNASASLPTGSYNAALDLISRNLAKHPDKVAFIDPAGRHTYKDVADRSLGVAQALLDLGLRPGDRAVLCLHDGIDFVNAFLGAIWAGVAPIPLNTLFPADDYAYILTDSEARAAVVSAPLLPAWRHAAAKAGWTGELIVSGVSDGGPGHLLSELLLDRRLSTPPHPSAAQDIAFWLYSSGSTGRPKGAPHRHASLLATAELFARQTLGLTETDVVFSAAKLFFAYGLGNALTFPMAIGATAVLRPERVTPELVGEVLAQHEVSVFCGVPTLFAALLASPPHGATMQGPVRLCLSAGEALPAEIGRAWTERTGVEIVDGVGSTEMLHIYVSNRPGQVRYGVTGYPVPGYEVRVVDEAGQPVVAGELGELYVRGPSMAPFYWNQPQKTAATFVDGWMRTGDKFLQHADGALSYCGRADDMLKVSGIWVSPGEVENALLAHEAVLEAAVIGVEDARRLVRTKAYVVTKPGVEGDDALAEALKSFVKARLAPHKYPRSIEFVPNLPKTATGKIRRHVLRERGTVDRPPGAPRP